MRRIDRRVLVLVLVALALGVTFVARNWIGSHYPQSRPGTGTVIGRLDLTSQKDAQYTAQDLYLGRLVPAELPNTSPAVSFSYDTDPKTVVHNADGTFAFIDVPPGTYALLIWTLGDSFVIQSTPGEPFQVGVEADKTTDLGVIELQ
jgi:hypothetical protein